MFKLFKRLMSIVAGMAQKQRGQTRDLSNIGNNIKDIQSLLNTLTTNLSNFAHTLSTLAPKTTAASVPQATTTLTSGK